MIPCTSVIPTRRTCWVMSPRGLGLWQLCMRLGSLGTFIPASTVPVSWGDLGIPDVSSLPLALSLGQLVEPLVIRCPQMLADLLVCTPGTLTTNDDRLALHSSKQLLI